MSVNIREERLFLWSVGVGWDESVFVVVVVVIVIARGCNLN